MSKNFTKKLFTGLKVAAIIYVITGVTLYFLQDKFLFHPEKLPPGHVYGFQQPFREIILPVTAEKNLSIIQFTVPDSLRKGVVLYFHGNRKNVARYAKYALNFTRNNYEVWMPDYPGFGKSTGERNESILYRDADIVYKMARAKFPKDSIIIYGKSIGTGIAAYLAAHRDCRQLFLETPYYSVHDLARHYAFMYPVKWMSKYRLPTHEYLQKVETPVTVFHGTRDEIIPYKHAVRLAHEHKNLKLVSIPGGKHNNLAASPLYHEELNRALRLP